MTLHGRAVIITAQVPAAEDKVGVSRKTCNRTIREREPLQAVRAGFQQLDACHRCRRNCTACTDNNYTCLSAHSALVSWLC